MFERFPIGGRVVLEKDCIDADAGLTFRAGSICRVVGYDDPLVRVRPDDSDYRLLVPRGVIRPLEENKE